MIFLPKHKGVTLNLEEVIQLNNDNAKPSSILKSEEMEFLRSLIDKYNMYAKVGSQAAGMAKEYSLSDLRQYYRSVKRYGRKNNFSKFFKCLEMNLEYIEEITPEEWAEYTRIYNKVENAFK